MGKYNVKHVLFLRADNPRRRCAPMQGVAGRALEAVGIEFIKQYDGQEQVGCAKLASANIETVFSGAGRISNKSRLLAAQVLSDYCFRHYNYHFDWLRPQLDEIIKAIYSCTAPKHTIQMLRTVPTPVLERRRRRRRETRQRERRRWRQTTRRCKRRISAQPLRRISAQPLRRVRKHNAVSFY